MYVYGQKIYHNPKILQENLTQILNNVQEEKITPPKINKAMFSVADLAKTDPVQGPEPQRKISIYE